MDQWNRRNPEQEVHPGDRFAEVTGRGLRWDLRLQLLNHGCHPL